MLHGFSRHSPVPGRDPVCRTGVSRIIAKEGGKPAGIEFYSATEISDFGTGSDGPSYANYKSWIYTVYLNAWVAPENATSDSAVVEATITIARDGTVISSSVTGKSGDSQMNSSVQRTLNRV